MPLAGDFIFYILSGDDADQIIGKQHAQPVIQAW
jgi:hypothetical protein